MHFRNVFATSSKHKETDFKGILQLIFNYSKGLITLCVVSLTFFLAFSLAFWIPTIFLLRLGTFEVIKTETQGLV